MALNKEALELMRELEKIVPNWQKLKLTKAGYNQQYIETIYDLAIFVLEREKNAIRSLQ